jgi:hypothetical protein
MKKITITRKQIVAIITAISIIVALFAFNAISEKIAERKRRMAFDNLNATALMRISELAVLKYRYTDVMELNRRFIVGGPSTSLVRFSGVVKAGIPDVTKIVANFDQKKNAVRVFIPRATIIDNTVDVSSVRIWDVKRNIFVPITTELKLQEISTFKDKTRKELETSGFLAEADSRAEELITSLFSTFGATITVTR